MIVLDVLCLVETCSRGANEFSSVVSPDRKHPVQNYKSHQPRCWARLAMVFKEDFGKGRLSDTNENKLFLWGAEILSPLCSKKWLSRPLQINHRTKRLQNKRCHSVPLFLFFLRENAFMGCVLWEILKVLFTMVNLLTDHTLFQLLIQAFPPEHLHGNKHLGFKRWEHLVTNSFSH